MADGRNEPILGKKGKDALASFTENGVFQNLSARFIAIAIFAIGSIIVIRLSRQGLVEFYGSSNVTNIQIGQLAANIGSLFFGFLCGFLPIFVLHLGRKYKDIVIALVALVILYIVLTPGLGAGMMFITGTLAALAGAVIAWWAFFYRAARRATTFGSALWAEFPEIEAAGLTKGQGFWLGTFPRNSQPQNGSVPPELLHYAGSRHLLTVAPTRAGKGVSAIIPNLLTYPGSVVVIDPKGENALITAIARSKIGQTVHIVDPWEIAAPRFKLKSSRFNPLDWLQASNGDGIENAMILADALVIKSKGDNQFWDEEAKALLMGLMLHVAISESEQGQRHLGRVRDLLLQDADGMQSLFKDMYQSKNPVVSGTGARCMQKEERLLGNVMASAQAHTHFLDSPRVRESLSVSDFKFEDLKSRKISVYLVLPADRLDAFGRWLRLLIQQAITVNARNITQKPEHPILFMLDEMASLGHLTMIEQAYSLMAGFGMQMWGIVQDLSQLERIYDKGWQTFVANSGVLQYFGSRDQMTAEYFSKLCGVTTVVSISSSISSTVASMASGGNTTNSTSYGQAPRNLVLPDELMTMHRDRQILLIENMNPIAAGKTVWYNDPVLSPLGINLHRAREAVPPPAATKAE